MHTALQCLALLARRHGVDTTPERLQHDYAVGDTVSTDRLLRIAQEIGLKSRRRRVAWADINELEGAFPVLCPLANGNWVVLAGLEDGENGLRVRVIDPLADKAQVIMVDQAALEKAWAGGELLFVKPEFRLNDEEQPFGLRWFVPEFLRQKTVFAEVALVALLMHVFALSVPIFMQVTFDKVVGNQSMDTLYVLTIAVVAALMFNAVIEYLRGLLLLHATSKIDIRVSTRTFGRLLSLPIDFFRSTPAGTLTKHMQQSSSIREFLSGRLFMTVLDCLALLVYIPILVFYSPLLASVVLAFTVAIASITLLIRGPYRDRLTALYKAEGDRQSLLVETIGGMETVKALAIEPVKRDAWDKRAAAAISMHINVGKLSQLVSGISKFLGQLMSVVILFLGVQLIFSGEITIGAIIAFNMLSQRVSGPLIALVGLINEFQQTALSVRMLGNVMNHPAEQVKSGGLTPEFDGRISFEGVSFKYRNSPQPALDQMSFEIKPGQTVGLVGRSGSGKSTVTKLLQGFYTPASGLIRLDGYDMREIDLAHLRMSLGVVLQESFLFKGTIKENISVTRPDATFFEIVSAAKLAGADEFVQRLPQGYDTYLEEGATNLSGGQKQRLAIARALLKQPRILILDEATSALDPESESIIQENMRKIAAGRTVISVSHRLSTLVDADLILVVDDGKISAQGPHHQLLRSSLLYRQLWERQNGPVAEAAE
ncbi:MAG: peptidase domain-containing ABC transporter [Pseudomonadota bacterium]